MDNIENKIISLSLPFPIVEDIERYKRKHLIATTQATIRMMLQKEILRDGEK